MRRRPTVIASVPVHEPPPTTERIEAIYRERLGELRRVARAALGDSEAARDAVQDGFVRAIRDRAAFRGVGTLEGWVWRCVVNAIRDAGRSLGRQRRLALPAEPFAELAPADDAVRSAIQRLPERQRLTLFLRYYADLDYADIADALGVAPGTVGAALHAAHAAVRDALREDDGD